MAAGQQRKRLTSSNLHEHYKGKKKKCQNSTDHILNLRSHVHLRWDEGLKTVVAKREQIGITWKDIAPYIDSMPKLHSGLADVFSFPEEIFHLDNLMEVLSHEVWTTCLSDSERKLLMLFLPNGASSEQAIHSLLSGENLHFGNPFLKWSTLLCSDDLHPDVICHKERQIRAYKNQYYREIHTYHTDMVEVLRMWKEKSATFKDPEKLWRKLSSMNNRRGVSAEKPNDVAIHKKELPPKMCIRNVDVDKYMSYIKVNKKQFEMAKELKHSGDGIQSKSLNHVLGDIKSFQIYPYESYEDEKWNKLQECWMQVTKDIPASFDEYNYIKLQNMQQTKCLEKELAELTALILAKAEKPVLGKSHEDHMKVGKETDHHSITNNEDDSASCPISAHDLSFENILSLNGHQELNSAILDQEAKKERTVKLAKDSSAPLQSVGNMDSSQAAKELKPLISSSNSTWIPANPQNSYYQKPSGTHVFASSCNLPLNQCQPVKEERAPTIDLEREIMEQDAGQPFPSAFNVESTSSVFSSYTSQSHDELIAAFPEAPEMLSSHSDGHINAMNQPRVQFFMGNGNLQESDRFSYLQDNQGFNKERQACEKELYMQHMIDKKFSTNNSYDQQGYYQSASSKVFPTLQSSAIDGFGRHNLFPNEHQSHNGWSGMESGNSASVDGSLFSVVSEYRNLPSQSSFETSGSEQLMQARNYIGMGMADQYISNQLRSSAVHNATPTPLDMMWMNYSHQNSVRQESSVRKSFPSPWQQ